MVEEKIADFQKYSFEAPWVRYPEEGAGSIFWRMGNGEDYHDQWSKFRDSLEGPEQAMEYLKSQLPAPEDWRDKLAIFITDCYKPEREIPDIHDRIDRAGLIQSDCAHWNWRLKTPVVTAPWLFENERPPEIWMRYRLRTYGNWSRWCQDNREIKTLESWIEKQGPPKDENWNTVYQALVNPQSNWTELCENPMQLAACELAATGTLRPPWFDGQACHNVSFDWSEDQPPEFSTVWASWIFNNLLGPCSFQAYLAKARPPKDWLAALKVEFPWLMKPD